MDNAIQRIVNFLTFMTFPRRLRNFCRRHPKGFLAYYVVVWIINIITFERQMNFWSRLLDRLLGTPKLHPITLAQAASEENMSFLEDYAVQADKMDFYNFCSVNNLSPFMHGSKGAWVEYLNTEEAGV